MLTNDPFRADLHCHSTCSDGTLSPEEIVNLAVQKGLSGLSITDHDSVNAYTTVLPYARERGIALISGVEFSTFHLNVSVHILGYSFAVDHPAILTFCARHEERRRERNQAILKLLATHHLPVSEADLHYGGIANQVIGRPHIALAMMRKGYVGSVQEAFHKYLAEGKPCYANGRYFTVEETIAVIHQAHGFAVIAHPHLVRNSKIIKSLLNLPFDGLEGYYACFEAREQGRWVRMGQERGWIVTGGSDFHGSIKPGIQLGSSWVHRELFAPLYQRFQQNMLKAP